MAKLNRKNMNPGAYRSMTALSRAKAAHERAVAKRDAAERAARFASFASQPDAEKALARAERAVERAYARMVEAEAAASPKVSQ